MFSVRVFAAGFVAVRAGFSPDELMAFEAADECGDDGESCALHALQVRAGLLEEKPDEAPIGPAMRSDVQGIPLQELGTSELQTLRQQLDAELESQEVGETDLGAEEDEVEKRDSDDETAPSPSSEHCFARAYTGHKKGTELCFCELVNNSACAGGCHCPQGCTGITWEHEKSVSFKNKKRAHGWPSTVILTSPRGYYKDVQDLKDQQDCTVPVINQLLLDGWNTFQEDVHKGSVWQCFHGSEVASVKYLHLQTFTSHGNFHGMPTHNHHVAMCVTMHSAKDSMKLAQDLANQIPR